ncbi:MAG TPA: LacI family DNA-binding transcriptional regulator, partial [Nocardioides sp.]|nr:LacI family DNA-binding transcriptional regulator [Nocardioides sp.]
MRRRVTIHDVAREAGVSVTTVSLAMNGKGTLAGATRVRVRETAERLGYQADPLARGLRNNPLGLVGLMLRPLDSLGTYRPGGVDYFTRLSGAVAVECLDREVSVMLVRDLTLLPRSPLTLSLDGYIVDDPIEDDPVIDLLIGLEIPFVTVGRDVGRPDMTAWVDSPLAEETTTVLDGFHGSGARSVAIVIGTDRNSWNLDSLAAYEAWCARRGVEPRVVRRPESTGLDGGREAVRELVAGGRDVPDAIYCLTGRHASGALEELRGLAVDVPERTQLVAGSDSEQCRSARPAISAIDLEPELVAAAAVHRLMLQLGRDEDPEPRELRSRLILR